MAKKKKKMGASIDDRIESSWSVTLTPEQMEKAISPYGTIQFSESLRTFLNQVHRSYEKNKYGRFKDPKKVAEAIMEGIAKIILPEGINVKDKKLIELIKAELNQRGISYDMIIKSISKHDVTHPESLYQILGEPLVSRAKEYLHGLTQNSLLQYMMDGNGKKKIIEHIKRRAGVDPYDYDKFNHEDAYTVMLAYMSQEDVFNKEGEVDEANTKLSNHKIAEIGYERLKNWEYAHKVTKEAKAKANPLEIGNYRKAA